MIGIIDYGLGNIRAFANVYHRLDIPHAIVQNKSDLSKCSKLILPGVGAFDHAMQLLNQSGLRQDIETIVHSTSVPILGICVGMQMLLNGSDEGKEPGLGWMDGFVHRFDPDTISFQTKLPHMGWNQVTPEARHRIFDDLGSEQRFYFLHSYYVKCSSDDIILATTEYGSIFTSAVNSGNIYGVQFHPEKSHHNGVQLLKNFAYMEPC